MNAKWLIIFLAATLMLTGCHSSRTVQRASQSAAVKGDPRDDVDARVGRSLVSCARDWLGTPYRYGGNDRRGVDCSGLTTNVFAKAAGVKLPRDSRSQKDFCRKIDRRALQAGDLVFFVGSKGSNKVNHVGLYVGDGQMIHASSSRGVMTSDITSGYWAEHYYASGRVDAVTYRWLGTTPSAGKSEAKKGKPEAKKGKERQRKAKKGKSEAKKGKERQRKAKKGRGGAISGASAEPVPAQPAIVALPEPQPDPESQTSPEPLQISEPAQEPVPTPAEEPEAQWFD